MFMTYNTFPLRIYNYQQTYLWNYDYIIWEIIVNLIQLTNSYYVTL